MKRLLLTILSFLCIFLFVSCSKEQNKQNENKWYFSKNIAREVCDDGWVYTFDYLYLKNDYKDDGIIPFAFNGINLRYKYSKSEKGKENSAHSIQILGNSDSSALKHDMNLISDILDYENGKVTKDELLLLNPDDINFEEIDKNLFFKLMNNALNGEAHKEGNYFTLPSYALLSEPEYLNDYKFQIGFLADIGCVDVMFIDVLYKQGDDYNDYVQLSDLVDNATATPEQNQAFELMKNIANGIVANNDMKFGVDENKNKTIGQIDFSRLYTFLEDIENNNYNKYIG